MRFGGRCLSLVALLFGAAAASLSIPSDGRAASGGVEQLLKSFDQVTMGGAGESQLGRIAKWVAPIRVKLAGPVSSTAKSVILEALKTFSELTSLDVALVDESKEGENILIDFGGRAGKWHCTLQPRLSNGSAMRYATIYIDRTNLDLRPSGVRILRRCVRHELMHALGFLGHTHSIDSILSYRHPNFDFTKWDELFVRTLYDPRLEVGTPRELALPVACEVISELLAARSAKTEESRAAPPAATPVHPYCAEKRAEIANTSDPGAQHRLAWAFKAGRGTPRDDARAVEWFTLAAEQGFVPAQTDLGQLYDKGQGVCRRTMKRRSNGTARRPSRARRTGNSFWGGPTTSARAWSPTPPRPSSGFARRRHSGILTPRACWGACIGSDAASTGILARPKGGPERPPRRAIRSGNSSSPFSTAMETASR